MKLRQVESGVMPQVRVTPDLFTVETGVESSFSFDRAGCLVRALWDGCLSRWGLDGACLVKPLQWSENQQRRQIHLDVSDGLARAAQAYDRAAVLLKALKKPPEPPWDDVLAQIETSGVRLMRSRSQHYPSVYEPVGILPPDQYGALVLQLTVGCRYNRCRFCTFYRGRSYREKSLDEFGEHIEAVVRLVGAALGRRRSVFLGDANAFGLPFAKLHSALELIRAKLPWGREGFGEVNSFMDLFGGQFYTAEELSALRRLGLRRLYIGAESGSPTVLRALNKPSSPERLVKIVEALKGAQIGVGLIFLLGAGGDRLQKSHAEETAELLSSLPLDARDVVYLSELVVEPTGEYAQWAGSVGASDLDEEALRQQERIIRSRLLPVGQGGPACTRYDIREFVHY
ncbi:MAG: radical SAM protein [Limnochordia bacterium]|jgi:hypothetical protein